MTRQMGGWAVLALVTLASVVVAAEPGQPKGNANPVAVANNDFAFDLYGQLIKEKEGKSLFFSPFSVSNALTIVTEGARGETAAEMGKALRLGANLRRTGADAKVLPWDLESIHSGFAALNKQFDVAGKPPTKEQTQKLTQLRTSLDKANRAVAKGDYKAATEASRLAGEINKLQAQISAYEIRVANALWAEKTYPFRKDYLATINRFHGAAAQPVDFRGDQEGSRQQINTWVEKQTKDRIKNLIPVGAIKRETRLVITNAIYFKGGWAEPFKTNDTKDQTFTLADGKTTQVATMQGSLGKSRYGAFNEDGTLFATPQRVSFGNQESETLYPNSKGFEVLEMPYKGGHLSAVVIVPRSANRLGAVEKMLTGTRLQGWVAKLQQRSVYAHVPKFKLETGYGLNEPLQNLGIKRAFTDPRDPAGAQFEGISEASDPDNKLYITKVLHKAFVEVNEKGTEAAAATAVIMAVPTSAPVSQPFVPVLKADKPFVFLIRDNRTGTVLFLGRVANPKDAA